MVEKYKTSHFVLNSLLSSISNTVVILYAVCRNNKESTSCPHCVLTICILYESYNTEILLVNDN